MPAESTNDFALLSIIIGPLLGLIGITFGVIFSRRNSKDTTNIAGFEANIKAFDIRATAAEIAAKEAKTEASDANMRAARAEAGSAGANSRAEALENDLANVKSELAKERAERNRERDEFRRMKTVVQRWFKDLKAAWGTTGPMPLPSEADMEWLELTQPWSPDHESTGTDSYD